MKSKNAELALEYVFLAFVGVIVVVVAIGLISGWTFNTKRMICTLSRTCTPIDEPLDNQRINLTDYDCIADKAKITAEIAKEAVLCYEKGTQRVIKGGLCYVVYTTCATTPNTFNSDIAAKLLVDLGDPNKYEVTFDGLMKASIFYDTSRKMVLIQ